MDSATGIGFTKPLAGQVWSVRKQPTAPIFRRDTCFVNLDSEPWSPTSCYTETVGPRLLSPRLR